MEAGDYEDDEEFCEEIDEEEEDVDTPAALTAEEAEARAEQLFAEMDVNNDGVVDREEFEAYAEKLRAEEAAAEARRLSDPGRPLSIPERMARDDRKYASMLLQKMQRGKMQRQRTGKLMGLVDDDDEAKAEAKWRRRRRRRRRPGQCWEVRVVDVVGGGGAGHRRLSHRQRAARKVSVKLARSDDGTFRVNINEKGRARLLLSRRPRRGTTPGRRQVAVRVERDPSSGQFAVKIRPSPSSEQPGGVAAPTASRLADCARGARRCGACGAGELRSRRARGGAAAGAGGGDGGAARRGGA